jgi:hypothetical protein
MPTLKKENNEVGGVIIDSYVAYAVNITNNKIVGRLAWKNVIGKLVPGVELNKAKTTFIWGNEHDKQNIGDASTIFRLCPPDGRDYRLMYDAQGGGGGISDRNQLKALPKGFSIVDN